MTIHNWTLKERTTKLVYYTLGKTLTKTGKYGPWTIFGPLVNGLSSGHQPTPKNWAIITK